MHVVGPADHDRIAVRRRAFHQRTPAGHRPAFDFVQAVPKPPNISGIYYDVVCRDAVMDPKVVTIADLGRKFLREAGMGRPTSTVSW